MRSNPIRPRESYKADWVGVVENSEERVLANAAKPCRDGGDSHDIADPEADAQVARYAREIREPHLFAETGKARRQETDLIYIALGKRLFEQAESVGEMEYHLAHHLAASLISQRLAQSVDPLDIEDGPLAGHQT